MLKRCEKKGGLGCGAGPGVFGRHGRRKALKANRHASVSSSARTDIVQGNRGSMKIKFLEESASSASTPHP